MPPARPRAVAVAVTVMCAAALITGAEATAGAAGAKRAPGTAARPAVLPPHVFAPYYFSTYDTLAATARLTGARYLTVAFLQTPKPGSCTLDWNGDTRQPVGSTYAAGIAAIQAAGGDVVPSFGGATADGAQQELADSCRDVSAIAHQYENVITAYHVTRLDLDTEENSLNNYAGIDRRNKAIALVERWAEQTGRTVQFVYTLPTNTTGLDQGGAFVLQNAIADHAAIAIVNIMTFDYYDNLPHEMADQTEGAAQQLFDRLHLLYPRKSAIELWGMIGVTEDLGVDDFGKAETFTTEDARIVERWAQARGLAEVSFWNIQDDNTAGSHVAQSPDEYTRTFEPFTSGSATTPTGPPATTTATGAADPRRGNLRSVSCPTAAFCLAVDESGNNALTWNGTAWSEPVPIDPGGAGVQLSAVSCADPEFCVAVDSLGRELTWTGAGWTPPQPLDNTALTAVSCPAESYCVAVDGDGNALTWNGASWSGPVRVDGSGGALQSVSCTKESASVAVFCAAGDWYGNVFTLSGATWSSAVPADSAGGGVSSLSCPAARFCVGTDWQGGEVTWNGSSWSHHGSFDQNGSQGLMSVSCPSVAFCAATDGSGDYLTWDGAKWSAPVMIDLTGGGIGSVSCASAAFCAAVDWNGNALTFRGAGWTRPAMACPASSAASAGTCRTEGAYTDPRAGVLAAVSCPSAAFCAAVDRNGDALTGDWPVARDIDPIAGLLTSVSCPSAAFCMAVDANGHALRWDGTSWPVPDWSQSSPADPRGGPLTSVSCTSAAFCLAVDDGGHALRWNGSSWSAPAVADPAGNLTGSHAHGRIPAWRWMRTATRCAGTAAGGRCCSAPARPPRQGWPRSPAPARACAWRSAMAARWSSRSTGPVAPRGTPRPTSGSPRSRARRPDSASRSTHRADTSGGTARRGRHR
jgi:chitinase